MNGASILLALLRTQHEAAWIYLLEGIANACHHSLTLSSIYQGRWNVAFRDREADIVLMCEDQGIAITSRASLASG